jgi:hypothetical protein
MSKFHEFFNISGLDRTNGIGGDPQALIATLGSRRLYKGAYFTLNTEESKICTELCLLLRSDFRGYITAIGHDWKGSIFAADVSRVSGGMPIILCFDVNSCEVLNTNTPMNDFLDELIIDQGHDVFDLLEYDDWVKSKGELSQPMRCVGYKVPLALSGSLDSQNMAECDLDVYWSLTAEIGVP